MESQLFRRSFSWVTDTPKQGVQTTHMKDTVRWSHLIVPAFLSAILLLVLAAGCAHQSPQPQPTFSALPPPALAPTSDRGNATVAPVAGANGSSVAPPPGAPPEDWELAETIRAELTKDKKLVHEPMEAIVNKGVVTLRGYAPTKGARQKLHDRIATLPGVKQVDDQIKIRSSTGSWPGSSQDFDGK